MTTKNGSLEIMEEKTKLITIHKTKKLFSVYPAKGPGTYADVQEQIKQDKLVPPTASETVSLVYAAFQNPDNKYSKEIIQLMKNRYLWAFTGNLYVPNKGVYIQDNPEVKDGRAVMKESDLIEKLEDSENSSVRFVPFGYKTGKQSNLDLAKNPYIIDLVGEEGAKKLVEVADKHKHKPYVYSFGNVTEETARVTALDSGWYWVNHGLGVLGYLLDDDWVGCAFGIDKVTEDNSKNGQVLDWLLKKGNIE